MYNLGNTRFRQGDYAGAIDSYEQALEINPEDTQARENLTLGQKKKEEQQQTEDREQQQNQAESSKDPGQSEPQQGQNGQQEQEQSDRERQEQQSSGDRQKQGSQTEPGQQPKREEEKSPGAQKAPTRNTPESGDRQQASGTAGAEEPEAGTGARQHAAPGEKELQRLQDRPGAAMMPMYREKRVEKDW